LLAALVIAQSMIEKAFLQLDPTLFRVKVLPIVDDAAD